MRSPGFGGGLPENGVNPSLEPPGAASCRARFREALPRAERPQERARALVPLMRWCRLALWKVRLPRRRRSQFDPLQKFVAAESRRSTSPFGSAPFAAGVLQRWVAASVHFDQADDGDSTDVIRDTRSSVCACGPKTHNPLQAEYQSTTCSDLTQRYRPAAPLSISPSKRTLVSGPIFRFCQTELSISTRISPVPSRKVK